MIYFTVGSCLCCFFYFVFPLSSNYVVSVDFNATKASARACLPLDDCIGCRNEINLDFSWFDFFLLFLLS